MGNAPKRMRIKITRSTVLMSRPLTEELTSESTTGHEMCQSYAVRRSVEPRNVLYFTLCVARMRAPEARPRRSKAGGNRGKDLLQKLLLQNRPIASRNERFATEDYRSLLALTVPVYSIT
jgi:hypothetical protein